MESKVGRQDGTEEEARRASIAGLPVAWDARTLELLMAALGDSSWRVRKEAVQRMAGAHDPQAAVPRLIAALEAEGNVGLRNAAIEALTLIGRPSVGALLGALGGGGEHRKMAIDALGAIGDPAALPALTAAMDDPDENLRAAAAEALGHIGGPRVSEVLCRELGRPELLGRLAALEALAQLGVALPLDTLTPLLGEPLLRRASVLVLGQTASAGALPYLLDALQDGSAGVREAAARALLALHGALGPDDRKRIESVLKGAPRETIQNLMGALEAGDLSVRRAAATLLGFARAPGALRALAVALGDDETYEAAASAIVSYGPAAVMPLVEQAPDADALLRPRLFELLPRLGAAAHDPHVGALLVEALDQGDLEAAAAAARALGEVGGKEALAPLAQAIENGEPDVAVAATHALGRLGGRFHDEVHMLIAARGLKGHTGPHFCRILGAIGRPEDRAILLGALKDPSPELRRAAAEALPGLGFAEEGVTALLFALTDESTYVRAAVARALGALGSVQAVEALMGATADEEPSVRAAAARSLGMLGDPRARATLRRLAVEDRGAVAAHAMEGLLRHPDGEDEALLVRALGHFDPQIVKMAVRGLAAKTSAGAHAALVGVLDHARWDVRKQAAEALAERGAAAREPLRRRAAIESEALVRRAIEQALAFLSQQEPPREE